MDLLDENSDQLRCTVFNNSVDKFFDVVTVSLKSNLKKKLTESICIVFFNLYLIMQVGDQYIFHKFLMSLANKQYNCWIL